MTSRRSSALRAATSARPVAALFDPTSVAVVGASEDPRKWGNWLANGALRGEPRRPAYLVNHRTTGTILGRRAYRSLDELPAPPDLVVVAVPVAAVSQTVDTALQAGARAIVVISAGVTGGADAGLDAALAARVRAAGAVLLGPNCLGVLDSGARLELVPNPLPAGSVGLISQSGNLALELGLLMAPVGLGFSRFASLGNQADLGAGELLTEFAAHDETELIALYIEDFRDGRAFARAAADAVAAGKPVVAVAIERSAAGSRAVRSHTGALASDGAAIDAACRAAGVQRVRTPRELVDAAQALLRCPASRGRRIAVLADGGGHGSIAAAVAVDAGLTLPELADATAASLRAQLPATAGVSNPVDLAGGAEQDVHAFDRITRELLQSGEIDALLVTGYFGGYAEYGPQVAAEELRTAELIGAAARSTGRPVVTHTMYPTGPAAAALRAAGVPVYESVEQGVGALALLAARGEARPRAVPRLGPPDPAAEGEGYAAARALLAAAGIRFVAQHTVRGAAAAGAAALELGYPVVLKALGPSHKSDAGGVVLGIADEAELRAAYERLELRLAPAHCSVERMAPLADGIELLIGARWDARFGPVALAGSGGVYAEILRDTAVALAPVTEVEAEAMLRSLRAAPLLDGVRGRPPLAVAAAAAALAALSRVAASHPELSELEINPLLVTPAEALALDARLHRASHTNTGARKCSSPTPLSSSHYATVPAASPTASSRSRTPARPGGACPTMRWPRSAG
jgi:acyl-CoA synthetase (NDP forming)